MTIGEQARPTGPDALKTRFCNLAGRKDGVARL